MRTTSAVAAHDWRTADPATRPTGDAAWTALGHAAALAQAMGLLDTDLARAAAVAGRPEAATQLARVQWPGLAAAAAAVRDLAERGPLHAVPDPAPRAPREVLLVASPEDLAPAAERLAHLVTTAASITPRDLQAVARAHAQATTAAAARLDAVLGHPAPSEQLALVAALADYARHLATAATAPRRTAALTAGDPRPLLQAGELARALAPGGRATTAPSAPGRQHAALTAYAHAAPRLTAALAAAATRELAAGRWLVPPGEDSPSRLTWVPPGEHADPPLRRTLAAAATDARLLVLAATRAVPKPAPAAAHLPGLDALTTAITTRQHTGPQPMSPAQPVAHRPQPPAVVRATPENGR